ncbi:MAG TPA: Hsp20/alpha crystallin family protein [Patescibacteria group bacterium]|nr:Hsp20/alpha crystallin family protein [Patescibacteria group bacterium]
MSLIHWRPFLEPFEDDKWFEHFGLAQSFVPSIDVSQDEKNVYVETPLAGFDPKDIEISVENGILTLSGKMEKKTENEEKNYYRREIRSGSFQRSVMLPSEVREGDAKADFAKGMLKITIPRSQEKKSKKVDIHVSDE